MIFLSQRYAVSCLEQVRLLRRPQRQRVYLATCLFSLFHLSLLGVLVSPWFSVQCRCWPNPVPNVI